MKNMTHLEALITIYHNLGLLTRVDCLDILDCYGTFTQTTNGGTD